MQIRVFSALVGKAREMGFAVPDDKAIATEGKFEGATVLEPKKGAHFEPVAALDFASREFYMGGVRWVSYGKGLTEGPPSLICSVPEHHTVA